MSFRLNARRNLKKRIRWASPPSALSVASFWCGICRYCVCCWLCWIADSDIHVDVFAFVQSGELVYRLGEAAGSGGHSARVHDVAFHPTQPLLYSCSADKSVLEWSLESGEVLQYACFWMQFCNICFQILILTFLFFFFF
jgi:WD40 repeat protein